MLLPSLYSPFDYLKQIETDLEHAADMCKEIKMIRHVGHEHHALESLEASFLDDSTRAPQRQSPR
jgi:hypothetical protein